jgi:hypothetical protein
VRTDGEISQAGGRPLGSKVLDVMVIKDQTLYYLDGKTGKNPIKNSYLRDLARQLGDKINEIVAITVKK